MQGDEPADENENDGQGEEDRPAQNGNEEEREEDGGEDDSAVDKDATRADDAACEVSQSRQRNSRPRSKLIIFVAHKLQQMFH